MGKGPRWPGVCRPVSMTRSPRTWSQSCPRKTWLRWKAARFVAVHFHRLADPRLMWTRAHCREAVNLMDSSSFKSAILGSQSLAISASVAPTPSEASLEHLKKGDSGRISAPFSGAVKTARTSKFEPLCLNMFFNLESEA